MGCHESDACSLHPLLQLRFEIALETREGRHQRSSELSRPNYVRMLQHAGVWHLAEVELHTAASCQLYNTPEPVRSSVLDVYISLVHLRFVCVAFCRPSARNLRLSYL